MNKTIKRILILFICIIAAIAVFTPNEADASSATATSTQYSINKQLLGTAFNINSSGNYVFVEHFELTSGYAALANYWSILCCQHGYNMWSTKTYFDKLATYNQVPPMVAYILAYMEDENDGAYRDAGQYAWWETVFGGGSSYSYTAVTPTESQISEYIADFETTAGVTVEEGSDLYNDLVTQLTIDLSEETSTIGLSSLGQAAYDFQSYICLALGGIDSSVLTPTKSNFDSSYFKLYSVECLDDDGNIEDTISVYGYDIDGQVEFAETNPDVSFSQTEDNDEENELSYFVGPFRLTGYAYDENYSYISGATLVVLIEGEEVELEFGENWIIKSEDTSDSALDENGFPTTGDNFYIVLPYQIDMTQIVKLSFDYTYWNAGGIVAKYDTYQYHYGYKTNQTTQDLAIVGNGAIWVETTEIIYETTPQSTIKIEKTTIDSSGNQIVYDGVFYFEVYVDVNGDGDFDDADEGDLSCYVVSVETTNGYGCTALSDITWYDSETAPYCEVYEISKDGWIAKSSVWKGSLSKNETATVSFTNTGEPITTYIEILKEFDCDVDLSDTDIYYEFLVTISGSFIYDGISYTDSSRTITASLSAANDWWWESGEITWYDEAPTYSVEEIEVDEDESPIRSLFKTLSYTNAEGTLSENELAHVVVVNTPDITTINVDKKLIDESEPESGEEFYVTATIMGTFIYENVLYEDDTLTIDIVLNESNNWSWSSEEIIYSKDNEPTYTIEETDMPDNYAYYETIETGSNDLTYETVYKGTLDEDVENVQIWNERKSESYLYLYKVTDTDELDGETFYFDITITGDFTYEGDYYDDGEYSSITIQNIPVVANGDAVMIGTFYWDDDVDAPTYDTSENNVADEVEVTIENGSGSLEEGKTIEIIAENNIGYLEGWISIDKDTNTADLDGETFEFELTITGNFKYEGTSYTTLTLYPTVTANGDTWVSGTFTWADGVAAPTYTVSEINIPDSVTSSSVSPTSGSLEAGSTVLIQAVNEGKDDIPDSAYINVDKKIVDESEPESGEEFEVTVTITGTFSYEGTDYDDETLTIDIVLKESNGWSWTSSEITFEEGNEPTYTVKETDMPDSYEYTETVETTSGKTNTKNTFEDTLDEEIENVQIWNEKLSDSDLYIYKVTDSDELDGETFYFNITIKGNFTYEGDYYDDGTYKSITIKNVPVVANGDSVKVGTFSWSDSVSAPKYTVTEVDVPDGVEATIEDSSGSLEEGKTIKIKAENNYDYQTGWIQIDKDTNSEVLDGEAFTFEIVVTGNFTYDGKSYTTSNPLTLEVEINANSNAWTSETFSWLESEDAPTYSVTEVDELDGVEASVTNSSGSLKDGVTVHIQAENKTTEESGYLKISKKLLDSSGNEYEGKTFTFSVVVTRADGTVLYSNDGLTITAGETWTSDEFTWDSSEEEPTYTITELDVDSSTTVAWTVDGKKTTGTSCTGSLKDESTVTVAIENNMTNKNSGYLKVTKNLSSEDKVATSDLSGTFKFEITIDGEFIYEGEYYDGSYTFVKTINVTSGSASWTSSEIIWFGDAPEYYVVEIYMPSNYRFISETNSSGTLQANSTVEAIFEDEEILEEAIILTMEIGGTVWNDTDYTDGKEVDTGENGIIDEDEEGIPGVTVTVTRVIVDSTNLIVETLDGVYGYDDSTGATRIDNVDGSLVTYTDNDGSWYFTDLLVPAISEEDSCYSQYVDGVADGTYMVSYDVTFSYDGQTYEPTTYLEYSDGNASSYFNASLSERENYVNDSMAYDDPTERIAYNEQFTEIMGEEEMDSNGDTIGTTSGGIELEYSSTNTTNVNGNTRKVSTLETYDSDGTIKDNLLMDCSTSTGGLVYPFDSQVHLTNTDKTVTLNGVKKTTYYFSATYTYCQNINLGLIEREYADTAVLKDLTSATVVVNGKATTYNYSAANDILDSDSTTQEVLDELLTRQLSTDTDVNEVTYTLGIYSSDYYYRADVYEEDEDLWDALEAFYVTTKGFGSTESALELEVYLTYTITVYNQSETYDVTINELADYYDETLTIVDTASEWSSSDEENEDGTTNWNEYSYTVDGVSYMEDAEGPVQIVEDPSVTYYDANGEETGTTSTVVWESPEKVGESSGITYYKTTTTSLEGVKIGAGESASITTTFRVNDDYTNSGIDELIQLGAKHNVAEVTNFTSYYSSDGPYNGSYRWPESSYAGAVAGRVDKDSAPDNTPVTYLGDSSWYEDDTDAAPIIKLELDDDVTRSVTGIVWEDSQSESGGNLEYYQVTGDGVYDAENETVLEGVTTELVEAISVPQIDEDGNYVTDSDGNTIYKEYDFIWPTEEELTVLGGKTLYELSGLHSSTETDENGIYEFIGIAAGNYKVRFVYGDTYVETSNVERDEDGNLVSSDDMSVLSGQDYKSTTYQTGFDNDSDDDGYTDNEWQDLSDESLNSEDTHVSDARDSEARRLVVAAKSEILTYDNTSILELADEIITNEDGDIDLDAYAELFGYGTNSDGDSVSGYEAAKDVGDVVSGSYTDAGRNVVSIDDDDIYGSTGYYMYAETAKLKLQVEDIYDMTEGEDADYTITYVSDPEGNDIPVYTINDVDTVDTDEGYDYDIINIDFGLEERSQTQITLDKQIKEIKLITSDGETILDAIYNITYGEDCFEIDDATGCTTFDPYAVTVEIDEDSSIGSSQIASLNRSSGTQGYRYIMIESSILQGTTIEITYQFTALNLGEADTCNEVLKTIWSDINESEDYTSYEDALTQLTSPYYTKTNGRVVSSDDGSGSTTYIKYQYGLYFGSVYYLGSYGTYTAEETATQAWDGTTTYADKGYYTTLVETTIHEIIDYIDPDVEFDDEANVVANQAWSTTTIEYLLENKLIDPAEVILVDEDGDPVVDTSSEKVYTLADAEITYNDDGTIDTITYPSEAADAESYAIISDELQHYMEEKDSSSTDDTVTKVNLAISNDDSNEDDGNSELIRATTPYAASYSTAYDEAYDEAIANGYDTDEAEEIAKEAALEAISGTITMQTTRYYSSEDDGSDIDNIAEIIKVENIVGRRDIRVVYGNTVTYQIDWDVADTYLSYDDKITSTISVYEISGEEPDTSATELITLTPPTGSETWLDLVMQILALVGCAGVILAIGIVLIKKKVLTK